VNYGVSASKILFSCVFECRKPNHYVFAALSDKTFSNMNSGISVWEARIISGWVAKKDFTTARVIKTVIIWGNTTVFILGD
jgi:hypothetical protein